MFFIFLKLIYYLGLINILCYLDEEDHLSFQSWGHFFSLYAFLDHSLNVQ